MTQEVLARVCRFVIVFFLCVILERSEESRVPFLCVIQSRCGEESREFFFLWWGTPALALSMGRGTLT